MNNYEAIRIEKKELHFQQGEAGQETYFENHCIKGAQKRNLNSLGGRRGKEKKNKTDTETLNRGSNKPAK